MPRIILFEFFFVKLDFRFDLVIDFFRPGPRKFRFGCCWTNRNNIFVNLCWPQLRVQGAMLPHQLRLLIPSLLPLLTISLYLPHSLLTHTHTHSHSLYYHSLSLSISLLPLSLSLYTQSLSVLFLPIIESLSFCLKPNLSVSSLPISLFLV